MTVTEYWGDVREELRQDRRDRENADPGYPAYPWDVYGCIQDPPVPVSYCLAAVDRLRPVIDLPRLRESVLRLLGVH